MHRNKFTLVQTPYALSAIKLGSLVPDRYQPDQDALHLHTETSPSTTRTSDKNFKAHIGAQSNSLFKTAITKLFSLSISSGAESNYDIFSEQAYQYMLDQPREVFHQLCQNAELRKSIELDAQRGDDWHFVVGYKTLVDGRLSEAASKNTSVGLTGTIPIGAATGMDPSLSATIDPEVSGERSSKTSEDETFQALGERVYSVCYRRVKVEFKSGQFDRSRMEGKNLWHAYTTTRASTAAQEYVEASLAEVEEAEEEIVLVRDEEEEFVMLEE